MLARVGRKKVTRGVLFVRTLPGTVDRMRLLLRGKEKLSDMARDALEREIRRRERIQERKAKAKLRQD